jgi:DNA-binding transcriptional ArsR family regulator
MIRPHSDLPDDSLDAAWRALADPTRRAILDLLRERAMTTGELADQFELSRFGVMKHLGVLVDAGLVTVRREGRQRWNELNPMPIHLIYRRWIRPFETDAADRLLRLKRHAESREEAG